ncbi:quinone oxidoreductase [Brevundimonas sp. AJA228-03]|uniref:quinone oxidoreductase family protein n=1 Tax=Brevundimonas sp. AJA228-03 TaxID=2752515 RepID=UPI001ADF290D|nr:quinone oxidoreductase [Brevundimonas sp. AJA228-03]QTN19964.1 quinone oxidoreductase [Brevundimonas sp. AJA228-03]
MRAIRLSRAGGPEVLELQEVETPVPGPGQILIRHEAIGLNFIDIYHRTGLYPLSFPTGLGLEGAGIVEAIGDGVTRFSVGDRAAYGTGPIGAYAEAHVVDAGRAVRFPADVPLKTAAAVMLKGMTSECLARRVFHVKQGDAVLVHAAAGGVGLILCQWLHSLGATVIGTVGDESKANIARAHGCDHVILYKTDDIAGRVRALTDGLGCAVVYDSVGRDTLESSLASLSRRGLLVSFGNASGPVPPIEPLRLSRGGSLFLTRPTLFDYVATTEELDESAGALFAMIQSGAITVEIGQTFRLDQVREAHEALAGRQTTGSTLLIP